MPWGEIYHAGFDNLYEYVLFINGGGGGVNGPVPGGAVQVDSGWLAIYDCAFIDGLSGGVSASNSSVSLDRTRFHDFPDNVVAFDGGGLDMEDCWIYSDRADNDKDLINGESADQVRIHSCCFYGGGDIIDLDDVQNASISNNTIKRALDKGITIGHGSRNIYLANNIILHCETGVSIHEDSQVELYNNVIAFNETGLRIANPERDNSTDVKNTALWRNGDEIEADEFADFRVAYSLVKGDFAFPGSGNQFENPHFIDQWGDNFHLRDDSPLIDAGWGNGCPERDFELAERIDVEEAENRGAGEIPYVDIGAFEFGSNPTGTNSSARIPETRSLFGIYPNPFNKAVVLEFNDRGALDTEIAIIDLTGRAIAAIKPTPGRAGIHRIWLNANDLNMPSGLYFVRLKQAKRIQVKRLVLIR